METVDVSGYKATERRIGFLTVVIGVVAAGGAAYVSSIRMGAGILVGSLVAWVGFRWLESALDGLVRASVAKAGTEPVKVPFGAIAKIVGRYALMGAAMYVIFSSFQVPVISMLLGLCALGAATIVATLYELWHPAN